MGLLLGAHCPRTPLRSAAYPRRMGSTEQGIFQTKQGSWKLDQGRRAAVAVPGGQSATTVAPRVWVGSDLRPSVRQQSQIVHVPGQAVPNREGGGMLLQVLGSSSRPGHRKRDPGKPVSSLT